MKTRLLSMAKGNRLLLAVASVTLLLSAGGGYYFGQAHSGGAVGDVQLPAPDALNSEASFSEIRNARQALQALSGRCITEANTSNALQFGSPSQVMAGQKPLPEAINRLEEGLQEFRGAEPELVVAEGLLRALRMAGHANRWMAVYLDVLYRHPTSELVMRFAKEAVQLSQTSGRRDDLVAGFTHLCGIPIEFDGKQRVHAMLARIAQENQIGLIESPAVAIEAGKDHTGG
jgi:hypothetical protein